VLGVDVCEFNFCVERRNLFYISTDLKCYDCRFWVGRCLKGRLNVIAISEACQSFTAWKMKRRAYTSGDL